MNNFYFDFRLQKPLKIQCNIDNYRAYLWDSGILTETAPITDKELKKYYKEDIGRADIYYEVEEYDYNEEKAFKAGLLPFISKLKSHKTYHVALHRGRLSNNIGNSSKLDAYYFLITGDMDKRSNYFIDTEKNKFRLAVGEEIFNAIENKFGDTNSKQLIEWYEYFEKYPNAEPITIQRKGMDFDHYFVLRVDEHTPTLVLCDMHVNDFEFLQYVPSYEELISLGWVKTEV